MDDDQAGPTISTRVRELIRQGAEIGLSTSSQWAEVIDAATLTGPAVATVAADPSLAEAVRRGNFDNLMAWAAANVRAPGEPVPANVSDVQLDVTRDMVRRGVSDVALDAYRTGQSVAWQRWMDLCFVLTDDVDELRELLSVTARSMSAFVDATVTALTERMAAESEDLLLGSQAERRDLVALVLQGAPVSRSRVDRVLGHRLEGGHLAAVLWQDAGDADLGRLEAAAERLMRAAGTRRRLTVLAGSSTLWLWLPVHDSPSDETLVDAARDGGVRVALGNPAAGIEGFRRSHREAIEAQRLAVRSSAVGATVTFDQIEVAAIVAGESSLSGDFTERVLGALADAPDELRETVRVYLRLLGNATATADRLFTHRNTVLRRLERANELLPRPLVEDPIRIAMALESLRWRS